MDVGEEDSGGEIALSPITPFKPGELVQVSATTSTLNMSGQGPISATVWQFWVKSRGGSGYFGQSEQPIQTPRAGDS